ncbi:MAG: ECF-type sigma factor [Planctomycetota bacterium]
MAETQITSILDRISAGEKSALDELIPIVYAQMKLIAQQQLKNDRRAPEPTEIVHEAFIRMIGNEKLAWKSRSHFFAACANVIRRILVDEARSRKAQKRGSGMIPVELNENLVQSRQPFDLIDLDDALKELQSLCPRQVQLVELRYFGGLTESESAEVLKISRRTAANDWKMAKAWLKTRL